MADDDNKSDTETSTGEQSEADSSLHKPPGSKPPRPPKAFWWRALLMIAVVIFLFSTIRDLANGQRSGTSARPPGTTAGTSVLPLVNGENVTIEEAPSLPPSEIITPTPGYYYYPYPSPPYSSRPGQGNGPAPAPAYPAAPQYPWYPPLYPWYAPYPPMGYGYPSGPGEQPPNNLGR